MDRREALAALAHKQWAGWMEYLFSLAVDMGGDWLISKKDADRWLRQMETPYADLPENEKDSDRKEADRVLALLEEAA